MIFLKEQLKEPISFFWTLISPCALFYFLAYARYDASYFTQTYMDAASWFYAYTSASIALFGVALYFVGRREAGFVRSFIYTTRAIYLYITAHLICHSIASLAYCIIFYLATRFAFQDANPAELPTLILRFYLCFLLFCIPALLLATCPLSFRNANTLFSMILFSILLLSAIGAYQPHWIVETINALNPFVIASRIMREGLIMIEAFCLLTGFTLAIYCNVKFFRINPVWSRY